MAEELSYEAKVNLAIKSIETKEFRSIRAAADAFSVSRKTVTRRMAGTTPQRDSTSKTRKLGPIEEEVIAKRILDMDARGYLVGVSDVRDMANLLIQEDTRVRRDPIGRNWSSRFIQRTPTLRTRLSRKYDYQRAKCEDPEVIGGWFKLVANTKAKYGILDDDIFNFDETGFMMGIIRPRMVVTASERRASPKELQPGNRDWTTVIQGVSATGWSIPPFIIFKGQNHLSTWYQEDDIPKEWTLHVSQNGWTTNELGLEWLKHFEKHTSSCRKGKWRLLILDSHESHNSAEFDIFCKNHLILPLYLPPHSSHLTQPLDVGCFGPLKVAYGAEISRLMRLRIQHISKEQFLPAFQAAFLKAFTPDNIRGAFRGSGLVPMDPDHVISKLDIMLRTPTPPRINESTWAAQTPSNAEEFGCQTQLIRRSIQRHQSSSPTPILDALDQLRKGAEKQAKAAVLIMDEVMKLREANEMLSRRRQRKRKRISTQRPLSMLEGMELVDHPAIEAQLQQEMLVDAPIAVGVTTKRRRCGRCGIEGHNSRTCQAATQAAAGSNDA